MENLKLANGFWLFELSFVEARLRHGAAPGLVDSSDIGTVFGGIPLELEI